MRNSIKSWLFGITLALMSPTEIARGDLWVDIKQYVKWQCFEIIDFKVRVQFCTQESDEHNTPWTLHLLWNTADTILDTYWESYIQLDWVQGTILSNWSGGFLEIPWYFNKWSENLELKCSGWQTSIGSGTIIVAGHNIAWKICN